MCIIVYLMKAKYSQKQAEIANKFVDVVDSKLFKSMGEPVRVQIIRFLLLNGQADIGTIAENMPQDRSVISRHLNLMHEVDILNSEKEGRYIFAVFMRQHFWSDL